MVGQLDGDLVLVAFIKRFQRLSDLAVQQPALGQTEVVIEISLE